MKKNIKIIFLNITMFMFIFFLITIFLTNYSNNFSWTVRVLLIIIFLIATIDLWITLIKLIKINQNLFWKNINDGAVFKILKIGTTFDKSLNPSKKTGYLEIETHDVKNVLVIFPIHVSCWEGIIPTEGKSYKKDGNYFTEIRFF